MNRPPAHEVEERTLLRALDELLDREDRCLRTGDTDGLIALALEREYLVGALTASARARRAEAFDATLPDGELLAQYHALQQRHETRAQVVRRFSDRTARAIGVLAQASGQSQLYRADGRVSTPWAAP